MCKAPFYDIRILSVKQPITLLSEKPCYDAQYCAYQNCRNDGADAHTAGTVNSDQAGDNGNQDHGAVKTNLDLGKIHSGNLGYGLHGTFACQRHQIRRQIEEDSHSDENRTDEHHNDSNQNIFRCRQKKYQVVAEGRKVTENHTDSNLQQVDRFKISTQKDNLDQNENGVKQNCCLAHFNAPDTGQGIRNGANRGYAQVGFD